MHPQETKIYIAVLIAAGVLAIILVYFIINIIRQQRRTQKINEERMQAEIMTMEKDRTRISHDLHDELGPILSAVKFKINSVEPSDADDKQMISQASDHIDEIIRRIREIANDLMPNTLKRKGIVHAIEEFIENTSKVTPMKITFHHNELPQLPAEKAIHLYRITQEIVHNAIKHSQAKTLAIELKQNGNNIVLITKDDGVGFNFDAQEQENRGLGLRNLQSRSDIMQGQFSAQSTKGRGVQYIFEIPIQKFNA